MRRFERLLLKPVLVWEIDVEGTNVTLRSGTGSHLTSQTRYFSSEQEAKQFADDRVDEWRTGGFVEIKRLAPVVEESIKRDARREWSSRHGRKFCEVFQHDKKTREVAGRVVDGYDEKAINEVKEWTTIREASGIYDGLVARMNRDAEREEHELAAYNERNAEKAAAKKAAKLRKQSERNRHPELEAECRASFDDDRPWSVYADWLIEQGDAIGEAAALARGGDVDAAKKVLRSNAGELHPESEETIEFELRHGFVHHVLLKIGYDAAEDALPGLVKRVLMSPVCRFVDSIRLGLATHEGYQNGWEQTLAAILECPQAPSLRELRLDAYESSECEISWVGYGDLAFAWPKLPSLELLHIRAGLTGELGTLELPKLRTYIRESGGLRRTDVTPLYAQRREQLEHLELWTGTARYEGEITLDDLQPIFDATAFPKLRHLGIVNSELSDVVIPTLAKSRVLAQLHSLDFSMGIAAKAFTDALVEHAAAFRHLASIDLTENVLYDEEIAAIRDVLDNVITNDQRGDREDDFEDDPGDRYVCVSE